MTQPVWVTDSGSLGTVPEGRFYRVPVVAEAGSARVFYRVIAGNLPVGMQVTPDGLVEGIPKNLVLIRGEPQDLGTDITSSFVIRAYTVRLLNGIQTVDRLSDRTFELTVTSQAVPNFTTPPGLLGTYYDSDAVSIQLEFSDSNLDETITVRYLSGSLPPGLAITRTGLITGVILPYTATSQGINLPVGTTPGYDTTPKGDYPYDFITRGASRNYQFAVEVSDGKDSNVRTFEIYVYSRDNMTADTIDFTADNTFLTADLVPSRVPVIITPEGDVGRVRSDNYFSYQFFAQDFDGDDIQFVATTGAGLGYDETLYDEEGFGFDRGALALPPGLTFDVNTGWLYGYIPDLGATELTYRFALRVRKKDNLALISDFYYFTLTITGDTDTDINWLTESNLGYIINGAISTLKVEAENVGGRSLLYRFVSGSKSRLPQGLRLLPSGNITGRVSFNTFALDNGTTTFDRSTRKVYDYDETTFDSQFSFSVNAYSPQTEKLGYQVERIIITDGGSGYTEQPQIIISPPPLSSSAIRATAGLATLDSNGRITSISVGNPGRGYLSPPTITISGGGGSGATAEAVISILDLVNAVSSVRRFTVRINRVYNEPYESIYIKAMPTNADRNFITGLLYNQTLLPYDSIYRADDPNFGIAQSVKYIHAYGLTAATLDDYVAAMQINHYWKNITLGPIRTAQALDVNGNPEYEVIYCDVIDNLVNNFGVSVGKSVRLPYQVELPDSSLVSTVYPNSLINMRDQIIDNIGQEPTILPRWMTSRQKNGEVLGFRPVWVIAYVKPGEADRLAYRIDRSIGDQLNTIDFKVDRYELDKSQSWLWNPVLKRWGDAPPAATTFDSYTRYLYNIPILDTNGVVASTETFVANGTQTVFGFVPLENIGAIIVTINGIQQPYLSPTTAEIDTAYRIVYTRILPYYAITEWDITEFYQPNTVVVYENLYYVSRYEVPPGVNITSEFYWRQIDPPNQVVFQTAPLNTAVVSIYQIKDRYILNPNSPTRSSTTFDGGSTTFVNVSDTWTGGDERDKYLAFPKINILG
jgi:hypothetical protein